MMWPAVLALLVCVWPAAGIAVAGQVPDPPAQVDIPDLIRMLRKQPAPPPSNQTPSHTQISYLPTISSNPAIGVGVGAVMSVAAQRAGAEGRLSTAQASLTVTTKSQVIGALRNNILSRGEAWSLVGDVRLAKFYQRAPMLGSDEAADDHQVDVNYNWIRVYQTAYRRLGGSFHLGVGYHLDSFMDITPADPKTAPEPQAIAETSTAASGLSANALFDSRDNPLNASRGLYGRASYHFYPESMGSDRQWQSLQIEGRAYVKLPTARRQVLAAWLQSWQTIDGSPPYFNLSSVGWDTYGRSARGYTAGSLRGPDWAYLEGEYRVDLMRNGLLGAVGFVNASSLSDRTGHYGAWAVGGGAGLRVKLDKQYGTNIAMDFAWGRNGSKGVWFGLNEVF